MQLQGYLDTVFYYYIYYYISTPKSLSHKALGVLGYCFLLLYILLCIYPINPYPIRL